ncbi:hypothetical protein KM043_007757 [Ampulex compressa]|nr:hypothetical protein KM043_007757 [Ampulex compressa]
MQALPAVLQMHTRAGATPGRTEDAPVLHLGPTLGPVCRPREMKSERRPDARRVAAVEKDGGDESYKRQDVGSCLPAGG